MKTKLLLLVAICALQGGFTVFAGEDRQPNLAQQRTDAIAELEKIENTLQENDRLVQVHDNALHNAQAQPANGVLACFRSAALTFCNAFSRFHLPFTNENQQMAPYVDHPVHVPAHAYSCRYCYFYTFDAHAIGQHQESHQYVDLPHGGRIYCGLHDVYRPRDRHNLALWVEEQGVRV